MSSGVQQQQQHTVYVCVCCPCACFFCRCVCSVLCLEGERAPVQLSGSDYGLTRPPSVHMKPCKPRPSPRGHAQAVVWPAPHVFVCQRECTFHTCDRRGGSRSSKLLSRGL